MAQEVNVAVLRKQISNKLTTLESAIKAYRDADKKYNADREAADVKYKKEYKAWKLKATKLVLKQLTVDNVDITINSSRYSNTYQGVSIDVRDADLSALGDKPVNAFDNDGDWRKVNELRQAIPHYFDQYGRNVDPQAVIFHFKKSLDMLEALPQGTVTITVKDFNFLTRY